MNIFIWNSFQQRFVLVITSNCSICAQTIQHLYNCVSVLFWKHTHSKEIHKSTLENLLELGFPFWNLTLQGQGPLNRGEHVRNCIRFTKDLLSALWYHLGLVWHWQDCMLEHWLNHPCQPPSCKQRSFRKCNVNHKTVSIRARKWVYMKECEYCNV